MSTAKDCQESECPQPRMVTAKDCQESERPQPRTNVHRIVRNLNVHRHGLLNQESECPQCPQPRMIV